MAAPKFLSKIAEWWTKMSKALKAIIVGGGILLILMIVAAIIVAIIINANKPSYKVLYSGLDAAETSDIIVELQSMGVNPQMNQQGEIMVPIDSYDYLLLQLASRGYPQSAPAYDVYLNNVGMTSTDSDRTTTLMYQLQNRLQSTIQRIDGVRNAIVNLNVPEESLYVWQRASEDSTATASVMLTLENRTTLEAAQVQAIKNLVAYATHRLKPDNVIVVDATTGSELKGTNGNSSEQVTSESLKAEQMYQNILEQNAIKILSARYPEMGDVVAVARVVLDFDKMMEEQKVLTRAEDGENAVTHAEQTYNITGIIPGAEGLVGEEDNTDIPTYPVDVDPLEDGGVTHYTSLVDIDYGYILRQIEKGEADVVSASMSVMLNDNNLTLAVIDELTNVVSNVTSIPVENISIASMMRPEPIVEPEPEVDVERTLIDMILEDYFLYLVAGVALLVLLIAGLIVFLIIMKKKKKRKQAQMEAELLEQQQALEREMADYRKSLEAANSTESKETIILDEVRNFAKENPQITASLIRTWLKEGEE